MSLLLKNVSFSYFDKKILKNFSLNLKSGEIGTLLGASGSGKTTLLKLLTGLIPLQQGTIEISDVSASDRYQIISYMMQQDMLLPWRTVIENVYLIKELGRNPAQEDVKEEAQLLLESVGLGSYASYYPEEISGGMRQRVSLARALMQKRPILLLDEPFGALDAGYREQMYALLRKINERDGTTILMITHDFRDAISLSDRIFFLNNGEIQNEWQITPALRNDALSLSLIQNELQILMMEAALNPPQK